jgi:hypothetical protein
MDKSCCIAESCSSDSPFGMVIDWEERRRVSLGGMGSSLDKETDGGLKSVFSYAFGLGMK